jgi:hypothetical protein
MKMRNRFPVLAAAAFALSIVKIRTSRDALDRKEKEGAVIDVAPVPQAQSK